MTSSFPAKTSRTAETPDNDHGPQPEKSQGPTSGRTATASVTQDTDTASESALDDFWSIDNFEGTSWLRGRLSDLQSVELQQCGHDFEGAAFIALWRPDFAACLTCSVPMQMTADGRTVCDRCGEAVKDVYPLGITSGFLMVTAALCAGCHAREAV